MKLISFGTDGPIFVSSVLVKGRFSAKKIGNSDLFAAKRLALKRGEAASIYIKVGNPFYLVFLRGGGVNAFKLFEFDSKVQISKKRTFNYGSILFPARVYAIFRGV